MKTFKQIILQEKMDDLSFVHMQMLNDENSSDKEMIAHLTAETKFNLKQVSNMVKKARPAYFKNPMMSREDGHKLLKKSMK